DDRRREKRDGHEYGARGGVDVDAAGDAAECAGGGDVGELEQVAVASGVVLPGGRNGLRRGRGLPAAAGLTGLASAGAAAVVSSAVVSASAITAASASAATAATAASARAAGLRCAAGAAIV